MSRRPSSAANAGEGIPLEHLAATAQMLADRLSDAAGQSGAAGGSGLQLVRPQGAAGTDEAGLAAGVRQYLRARRLRDDLFPEGLFADPAWDMMLDLFASTLEGKRVCVSSACLAASVPPTTALRWLNRLEECGLVLRRTDAEDSRRINVEVTDLTLRRVRCWLTSTFQIEDTLQNGG